MRPLRAITSTSIGLRDGAVCGHSQALVVSGTECSVKLYTHVYITLDTLVHGHQRDRNGDRTGPTSGAQRVSPGR
jgi:hypothetical protein